MPAPYALQVASRPNKVSEEVWTQWYTEEHIRELVYSGATKTSAVYRASSETISSDADGKANPNERTDFLALYQSTAKHVLEACNAPGLRCKVRIHSELFEDGQSCYDVGTFKPLDLQLVEILGSYEHREDVPSHLLHHIIASEQIENKIQFDHVNAVAELDGYRRTLLYRPIEATKYGGEDLGPYIVLLHEFDGEVDVGRLSEVKRDLEEIEPTKGCAFWLRPYRLIESEGFEGRESRVPERMER